MDERDYRFFELRMKQYKMKQSISILAYALMPNHFHIFVRQKEHDKPAGKFISLLANSYTKAFNKRYERNGVLLQGPTKIVPIDSQSYYMWLCKYILRNPVKARLVEHPAEWSYSSASEYYGSTKAEITDTGDVLSCFKTLDEFKSFIDKKEDDFDYGIFE